MPPKRLRAGLLVVAQGSASLPSLGFRCRRKLRHVRRLARALRVSCRVEREARSLPRDGASEPWRCASLPGSSELGEWRQPAGNAQPAGECLGADDVLAFCDGRLDAQRYALAQHHLEACSVCLDLITGALDDWAPRRPSHWLDVGSNFRPGDIVEGRYRITRFLARGGMGEVYEALDLKTSGRVALKALLASLCDHRGLVRTFRREARLARSVSHPYVCRVLELPAAAAFSGAAVPYFTMALIEGTTLASVLRQGPMPCVEAVAIARQLSIGLRAIHSSRVLHLDLKSSNIMLRCGRPRRVVIVDFGLARRAGQPSARVHPLVGSLPYMAPEQILGQPPGYQNDVFALGVVIFQMLTGELPFPPAKPNDSRGPRVPRRAAPLQTGLAQRLVARPPRPSQLCPSVPRWLDEVVLGCLAETGQRYPDAASVLQALDPRGRKRPAGELAV